MRLLDGELASRDAAARVRAEAERPVSGSSSADVIAFPKRDE
jgi:hypothetical protein